MSCVTDVVADIEGVIMHKQSPLVLVSPVAIPEIRHPNRVETVRETSPMKTAP